MRILIAPDKFKGSLTAPEAAEAIAVLRRVSMAHGGEGAAAANGF